MATLPNINDLGVFVLKSEHLLYEDYLFEGMCAALEVLKDIHKKRGEEVEFKPLVKRVLVN